jgi:hypothetical protein
LRRWKAMHCCPAATASRRRSPPARGVDGRTSAPAANRRCRAVDAYDDAACWQHVEAALKTEDQGLGT